MYYNWASRTNYTAAHRKKGDIKYIVVHYTAGNGDTARNNLSYFKGEYKRASAHFFVDEKEVCQSVKWNDIAWHCGKSNMACNNFNSIGVEMCSRKDNRGVYYFKDETVVNAARFVASLMKDFNIPISNVIRHYDVNGKKCPAPFVDERAWADFKNMIERAYCGKDVETVEYYEKLEDIPEGVLRNTVAELVESGIVKGDGSGLHLTYDMVRNLVFCKRMIEKGKD